MASIQIQLEHRRRQLGMSCAAVAARAGLSLRTVQRALTEGAAVELETLIQIAQALGASLRIELEGPDVDIVRRRQAEQKAAGLVSLTQGTSALEAQGIAQDELRRMKERATTQLLAGSARKLWA